MNLKVPYHHQKNCYFCGPTSLKIVLEKFGVKRTEKELARIAGTSEKDGTSHCGMIKACRKFGFSCFVHENANLRNIESFLKAGLPVISDWTDSESKTGHYSVITEIGKKNVFFCDPWYGPAYAVERKTFEKFWKDGLTKGRKWIMIVLPQNTKIKQEIEMNLGESNIAVKAGRIYQQLR